MTGTATDQSGALLPGVTARITNPETGFQREVQSNDIGAFAACEWLIQQLKRSVPIWKKEFYADGSACADGENLVRVD